MHEITKQKYLAKLRHLISSHFNISDLKSLCFDLGIDYENLSGEIKDDKVRELITLIDRQNRLNELVNLLIQMRPNLEITYLVDDFFEYLKFIEKQNRNLTHEFISERNEHWENFQETIDALDADLKFEVQKMNTLSYLHTYGLTVTELKVKLLQLGHFTGEVNNSFTTEVVESLIKFQRMNNLKHVDGVFGPLTYAKMAEKYKDYLISKK